MADSSHRVIPYVFSYYTDGELKMIQVDERPEHDRCAQQMARDALQKQGYSISLRELTLEKVDGESERDNGGNRNTRGDSHRKHPRRSPRTLGSH